MEEGDDFGPVAASVRRLGGRVTVSQVVMDSGLSVDDVEAELGALLRDAGGLLHGKDVDPAGQQPARARPTAQGNAAAWDSAQGRWHSTQKQ